MARTWSTFNAPPQWGKMTGIPSDFSDGKIDWDEVKNKPASFTPSAHTQDWGTITGKPATYPHTPFAAIEFAENSVNYLDFHVRGQGQASTDFDARIIVFLEGTQPYVNSCGIIGYQALKHYFYGSFFIFSLPSSSTGLASGQLWRDSNGFLRAV